MTISVQRMYSKSRIFRKRKKEHEKEVGEGNGKRKRETNGFHLYITSFDKKYTGGKSIQRPIIQFNF
jgi:hypothetical protein